MASLARLAPQQPGNGRHRDDCPARRSDATVDGVILGSTFGIMWGTYALTHHLFPSHGLAGVPMNVRYLAERCVLASRARVRFGRAFSRPRWGHIRARRDCHISACRGSAHAVPPSARATAERMLRHGAGATAPLAHTQQREIATPTATGEAMEPKT